MNKKIQRITGSYYLRGSGINNNRYGWFNESTNEWEILPTLTYYEALRFDFNKYYNEIEKYKKVLVDKILKDKKVRAKIDACNKEDIEQIKECFGVKHIKFACQNYDSVLCANVSNKNCFNCVYRFNDYESLTNKNL